jgi:hypothetical protein
MKIFVLFLLIRIFAGDKEKESITYKRLIFKSTSCYEENLCFWRPFCTDVYIGGL